MHNEKGCERAALHSQMLREIGSPATIAERLNAALSMAGSDLSVTASGVSKWHRIGVPFKLRCAVAVLAKWSNVSVPSGFLPPLAQPVATRIEARK